MHRGGFLTLFLIIAGITLLLDWYVYSGLRTFTTGWSSPRKRHIVLWGYLIVSIGITALFLLGIRSFRTAKGMTPYHEWILSFFLIFFITKIFFALVLLIGDLGRLFYGVGNGIINHGKKVNEPFFSR